jgi:hypothetical protein
VQTEVITNKNDDEPNKSKKSKKERNRDKKDQLMV